MQIYLLHVSQAVTRCFMIHFGHCPKYDLFFFNKLDIVTSNVYFMDYQSIIIPFRKEKKQNNVVTMLIIFQMELM